MTSISSSIFLFHSTTNYFPWRYCTPSLCLSSKINITLPFSSSLHLLPNLISAALFIQLGLPDAAFDARYTLKPNRASSVSNFRLYHLFKRSNGISSWPCRHLAIATLMLNLPTLRSKCEKLIIQKS